MRKQITTALSFKDIVKMSYHDILRMMGFSFRDFNGVTERKIKEDCKKLPKTMEYKTTDLVFKNNDAKTKVFLITYLFIYKYKYGVLFHDSWESLYTSILNDKLFNVETYLINRNYSMIVNVDENAFIDPQKGLELLFIYKDGSVYDAPKHLSLITGLDYGRMNDFCGNKFDNLVNEVRAISNHLSQTNDWKFKEFRDKFNMNLPTYSTWSIPNYWDTPNYLLASDYLYYLFFIKTVNDWDVSKAILKQYLDPNNHNDIEKYRNGLLMYFNENTKLYNPQMSFCYEEHLFALKNHFKVEYVLNLTKTQLGFDTELYNLSSEPAKETITVNTISKEELSESFDKDLSMIDLRKSGEEPKPLNITKVKRTLIDNEPSDFVSIANKQIELYKKKNKDYGNATDILYKKHGFTYYQIMLEQKMQRIDSITNNNKEHNFESLEDSLLDLSNYALLAVESLRKEKQ